MGGKIKITGNFEFSRGCRNRCAYCCNYGIRQFYKKNYLRKKDVSRFIEEIIWREEKRDKRLYGPEKIKRIEFKVAPIKEEFSLRKTPSALEILRRGTFSPSSIDTYLNCPARFYFRYCLGLKEKEEISEELAATSIEMLVNAIMASKEIFDEIRKKNMPWYKRYQMEILLALI